MGYGVGRVGGGSGGSGEVRPVWFGSRTARSCRPKPWLALADGVSVRGTARLLGAHQDSVARWRDRFLANGVAGIGAITPDRGRPPATQMAVADAVVHDTLHTVPDDGSTCWTTRTMAARHGVSKDTVARIWRARNLRPWRTDTFKLLTDPRFEEKRVDVVGLYLNPAGAGPWCSVSTRKPSTSPGPHPAVTAHETRSGPDVDP